jgi:hypothetical protein
MLLCRHARIDQHSARGSLLQHSLWREQDADLRWLECDQSLQQHAVFTNKDRQSSHRSWEFGHIV